MKPGNLYYFINLFHFINYHFGQTRLCNNLLRYGVVFLFNCISVDGEHNFIIVSLFLIISSIRFQDFFGHKSIFLTNKVVLTLEKKQVSYCSFDSMVKSFLCGRHQYPYSSNCYLCIPQGAYEDNLFSNQEPLKLVTTFHILVTLKFDSPGIT